MKKLALMLLLAAAVASPASASEIQISVSDYGPYQTGRGGEFTLHVISGLDTSSYADQLTRDIPGYQGSFQSFCLEDQEFIYENAVYDVTVHDVAVMGGTTVPGGDPISVGTGWLYSQFATGNWEGTLTYDYIDPGRSGAGNSAQLLQRAIWQLEKEISGWDATNPYLQAVLARFGSKEAARADGGTAYNVWVLTLTDSTTHALRQDQLYYYVPVTVPDGGATLILLGTALLGVAVMRRKLS